MSGAFRGVGWDAGKRRRDVPGGRCGARGGRPPPRAARAEHVPTRVLLRPNDDSACFGPTASVVPAPPSERGVSNIRRTRHMVSG